MLIKQISFSKKEIVFAHIFFKNIIFKFDAFCSVQNEEKEVFSAYFDLRYRRLKQLL